MNNIKNKYHKQIKIILEKEAKENPTISKLPAGYSGSKKDTKKYPLSNPQIKHIAKAFYRSHKNLNFKDFIELLDSLYIKGESTSEKYVARYLLVFYKKYLDKIEVRKINTWLNYLTGWAQVDSLCQSVFTAEILLNNWGGWEDLLKKLNKSNNINKRRSSLVLLTKPVEKVTNLELKSIAFANIQNLKHEKEILITKAISWLLRSMVKNYKEEVKHFLLKNKNTLPRVAVRETKRKIRTGKK